MDKWLEDREYDPWNTDNDVEDSYIAIPEATRKEIEDA